MATNLNGMPKELAWLQELKKLNLKRNPLGSAIPPGLGGLNALEELNLGWIILKKSASTSLGSCEKRATSSIASAMSGLV